MNQNYYEILGLNPNATLGEVKKAFRIKIMENLPDINSSPNASELAEKIIYAYKVLSNPDKRMDYDRKLGFFTSRSEDYYYEEATEDHKDVNTIEELMKKIEREIKFKDFYQSKSPATHLARKYIEDLGESISKEEARRIEPLLVRLIEGQRTLTSGYRGPCGRVDTTFLAEKYILKRQIERPLTDEEAAKIKALVTELIDVQSTLSSSYVGPGGQSALLFAKEYILKIQLEGGQISEREIREILLTAELKDIIRDQRILGRRIRDEFPIIGISVPPIDVQARVYVIRACLSNPAITEEESKELFELEEKLLEIETELLNGRASLEESKLAESQRFLEESIAAIIHKESVAISTKNK